MFVTTGDATQTKVSQSQCCSAGLPIYSRFKVSASLTFVLLHLEMKQN